MKRRVNRFFNLVVLLFAGFAVNSCDKMPSGTDLDGQWQMMKRYSKVSESSTAYEHYQDMKAERIYWRFQLDLLMIVSDRGNLNGHTAQTLARYRHDGNRLQILQTYINFVNRDSLITDPNTQSLVPVGIHGNATTFDVLRLNGREMVLRSQRDSIVFRKF